MLPNEILPAIPRQKVKSTTTGEIYEVLGYDVRMGYVIVPCATNGVKNIDVERVEPVPEEPRPLRVGDKLYNNFVGFFQAVAVKDDTEVLLPNGNWAHKAFVRFATPQECKDYFN